MYGALALVLLLMFGVYAGGAVVSFGLGILSASRARKHRGEYALVLLFLAVLLCEPLLTLMWMIPNYPLGWPPSISTSFRTPIETAVRMTAPTALLVLPLSGLLFRHGQYRRTSIAILALGAVRWFYLSASIRFSLLPGVGENPAYLLFIVGAAAVWFTSIWDFGNSGVRLRPTRSRKTPKSAFHPSASRRDRRSLAALALISSFSTPEQLELDAVALHRITVEDNVLKGLAWSPDGTLLAVAGEHSVYIWHTREWPAHENDSGGSVRRASPGLEP